MTDPKRPGRPPLDARSPSVGVHVRLPSTHYDDAYQRAQQAGISVPEFIRRSLQQHDPKLTR